MNREIQIVTVAFIDNESHSNALNLAVHGPWDPNPPFSTVFTKSGVRYYFKSVLKLEAELRAVRDYFELAYPPFSKRNFYG